MLGHTNDAGHYAVRPPRTPRVATWSPCATPKPFGRCIQFEANYGFFFNWCTAGSLEWSPTGHKRPHFGRYFQCHASEVCTGIRLFLSALHTLRPPGGWGACLFKMVGASFSWEPPPRAKSGLVVCSGLPAPYDMHWTMQLRPTNCTISPCRVSPNRPTHAPSQQAPTKDEKHCRTQRQGENRARQVRTGGTGALTQTRSGPHPMPDRCLGGKGAENFSLVFSFVLVSR